MDYSMLVFQEQEIKVNGLFELQTEKECYMHYEHFCVCLQEKK
jgi:hypothetical protein